MNDVIFVITWLVCVTLGTIELNSYHPGGIDVVSQSLKTPLIHTYCMGGLKGSCLSMTPTGPAVLVVISAA